MFGYNFGDSTMTKLVSDTQNSGDELGQLITELMEAAEPLRHKFEGEGKNSFDALEARAKEASAMVSNDLGRLNTGQTDMRNALLQGDQQMADAGQAQLSAASFDGSKFRA